MQETNSSLVFTEMSSAEKTNKRNHSLISKKSKYAESDDDEEDDKEEDEDYSENEC